MAPHVGSNYVPMDFAMMATGSWIESACILQYFVFLLLLFICFETFVNLDGIIKSHFLAALEVEAA